MENRILCQICTRDRPTELGLLLQSLRTQTYKNFDVHILQDGSGTDLSNYYFISYIITRMKLEGNNVTVFRNEFPSGVSKARQRLIDEGLKTKCELFVRLDDDSVLDEKYLEKLMEVINEGYDVASGVVPPLGGPIMKRDINFVKPIIGYCALNENGELIANFDDCGVMYNEEAILPSPHFRSCALFKREIFENGVDYDNKLSKNGFREEQWLSWKILLKGYTIGCHTGAISWHMMTPSGGERDTMNLGLFNQQQFVEFTKRLYKEKGDFLKTYYDKLKVTPKQYTELELKSQWNLVEKK